MLADLPEHVGRAPLPADLGSAKHYANAEVVCWYMVTPQQPGGASTTALMLAGRWRSERMPARYARGELAGQRPRRALLRRRVGTESLGVATPRLRSRRRFAVRARNRLRARTANWRPSPGVRPARPGQRPRDAAPRVHGARHRGAPTAPGATCSAPCTYSAGSSTATVTSFATSRHSTSSLRAPSRGAAPSFSVFHALTAIP